MRVCLPVCLFFVALQVQASAWQPAHAIEDAGLERDAVQQPLFVIGLPTPMLDSAHRAILARFGSATLDSAVPVHDRESLDGAAVQEARTVIALGRDACAAMIVVRTGRSTLCALIYADAFDALDCGQACEHLEAIVLDQPPERQAAVASHLFPALGRFGVLRQTPLATAAPGLEARPFDSSRRLSTQLTDLLAIVDAIIVEPRASIYPPQSLRTVLLTAYGRDRPIVGYGPDWVRAGALVSAWSSADDVLGDVEDILRGDGAAGSRAMPRVHPPRRFHVSENPVVARSLGLRRRLFDVLGRQFLDEDFLP